MTKHTLARLPKLLAISLAAALCSCAAADSLTTLDAKVLTGQVVQIGPQALVMQAGDRRQNVALQDVAEITLGEGTEVMAQSALPVVVTAEGAKLVGDVTIVGGKIKLDSALLGARELDIAAATAVYFPATGRTGADIVKICDDLKIPAGSADVLVIQRKAGDFLYIEGVLKELGKTTVVFTWKNEDRKIERPTVVALRLASTTTAAAGATGRGLLRGAKDGSVIPFAELALAGGEFSVRSGEMGQFKIKRAAVASVEFLSDRVVNLSNLQPTQVTEHGFLDKTFPYRRGLAAGGGPLRLGGETYRTGLGLHSFCELIYKLDAAYGTLVALAGIDDSVRPAGNARLSILGDGKDLTAPMDLTGKNQPIELRVKLAGVKQLTIRVEFGADAIDVGDQVDLAGARLIK